jgi:hypothetical protein
MAYNTNILVIMRQPSEKAPHARKSNGALFLILTNTIHFTISRKVNYPRKTTA